jgi:hypothetical protein
MRTVTTLLAFLFWLAGPAAAQAPAAWTDYRPLGGGFSVALPGTPKLQSQTVQTAAGPTVINMSLVERGDAAYVAMYNDFPAASISGKNVDGLLDAGRDGQSEGKKLLAERRITLSGRPARELLMEGSNYIFVSRIVMAGPRLIQIIYAGPRGTEASPDTRRFIDSLKLDN